MKQGALGPVGVVRSIQLNDDSDVNRLEKFQNELD